VLALHWDDTALHWAITVRNDTTGTTHHYTARTIISAIGQLNRPKRPAIPGAALFSGPQFHTAEWNHAVDLAHKRVAVIGTGPSAAQVIPAIAGTVKELHVFQRSPVHILPREDYVFSDAIKTLFAWFPPLQWVHHLWLYVQQELGPYRSVHLNAAENRGAAESARLHMQRQIPPERKELREKFTPMYPYGCKRPLFSDSYYPTFLRDNVHLHTTPPAEITGDSIITAEGSVAVDVIIWATGFETQDLMGHIEVRGHQGVLLKDKWGDEATAYLGTSTSGFPNLFWVYGPATGLLWGSLTFMFETQAAWNVMMLRRILEEERAGRRVAFAVRRDTESGYNLRVQRKIGELAYGGTRCESFYKNSRGVVTTNFPWRLVVYWWWLRSVDWRDYERWEVKV
jgi:cation diffusion facilitator CzcD-associated flavoprotein CzcO